MKLNKYIMGLVGSVCMLTSCSDSDNSLSMFEADSSAVKFTASVGSRAAEGESTETGETVATGIKIGISSDNGSSYLGYTAGNNGILSPNDSANYIRWRANSIDILAYAPLTTNGSATSFTLPTDQSKGLASADYMTYAGKLTRTDENINSFKLTRRMSLVTVKLAKVDNRYSGNGYTFDIKITSPAAEITLSYSAEAAITATDNSVVVTPYGGSGMQVNDSASAIITPGTLLAETAFISVQVKKDGKEEGSPLYAYVAQTFMPGNSYEYSLTVSNDELSVGGVQVEGWGTTDIEGGFMTEDSSNDSSNGDTEQNPDESDKEEEGGDDNNVDDNTDNTPSVTGAIDLSQYSSESAVAAAIAGKTDVTLTGAIGNMSLKNIFANMSTTLQTLDISTVTGLTEIEESAFYGFTALQEIKLPTTITTIGKSAFSGCTALTGISSESVTTIKGAAFCGCTALKTIDFPELTIIESGESSSSGAFYECKALTCIDFPKLKTIGNYSFRLCNFTSVSLVDVSNIGMQAFHYSTISQLTISGTVYTSLGTDAFTDTSKTTLTLNSKGQNKSSVNGSKWGNYTFKEIKYITVN